MKYLLPLFFLASCGPSRYLECPKAVTVADTVHESILVSVRPTGAARWCNGYGVVMNDKCVKHLDENGKPYLYNVRVVNCETKRRGR